MRLRQKLLGYVLAFVVLFNVLLAILFVDKFQNLFFFITAVLSLNGVLIIVALRSMALITDPLENIIKTLELNIKGEKRSLDISSSGEFASLANNINRLLDMRESSDVNLKEAQEQITQAQRWVLLGRLASGVVHEINNPLDGVINCIHTMKTRPLTRKQTNRYLELVAEGLFRIETITKRLHGLSRENPLCLTPTDLNELVEKASFFVDYRMTRKRISLRCKFTSDLPLTNVDQGAILQVLVNICLNAIDSMSTDGVLSITTTFDEDWLKIRVADTGTGIAEDMLDKIFLPFFTTKKDGIGLGLPICQNIITQHRGVIDVESIVNKGTIFTIKLPACTK